MPQDHSLRSGLQALLLVLLLATRAHEAFGQGLKPDPGTALASAGSYQTLTRIYGKTRAWIKSYKYGNRAAACSLERGSLCAAGIDGDEKLQLLMATSPLAYDTRRQPVTAVGPVKDQRSCSACLAFAVVAAAQSAMATALQREVSGGLSEHDFYFCKGIRPGFRSSCEEAFTLRESVEQWLLLHRSYSGKFVTTTDCLPYDPTREPLCAYTPGCNQLVLPELKSGEFVGVPLRTIPSMQEHIRNHGSIICRIDIYSDFRSFYKAQPGGIYRGPGEHVAAAMSPVESTCR